MSWFGPVATLGECPRWDAGTRTLSWVDIDGGNLHRASWHADRWVVTADRIGVPLAGAVSTGTNGSAASHIVAIGGDLVCWSESAGPGRRIPVLAPDSTAALRLNEMVTDPAGRIWVGSMAYDWTPGAGSFFVLGPDGLAREVITGRTITNGVGWSPDGTVMYTTETRPGCITAWRVGPDGDPVDPRPLVSVDGSDGQPDGLAVDTDGNLWSAFAGGGHIACFSPRGRLLHRVEVPAPLTTSCCFAGPGRDRLVVTTGTKRLDRGTLDRFPGSGRVWDAGVVGATGLPQVPAATSTRDRFPVAGQG